MPSDDRADRVFRLLGKPTDRFLSAVAATMEELRGFLSTHPATAEVGAVEAAAALGPFARGLMDPARLPSLGGAAVLDVAHRRPYEEAFEALASVRAGGGGRFRVQLLPGEDLGRRVGESLARAGRAFQAVRLVEAARNGREPSAGVRADLPFSEWTSGERRLAPPLLVELDGRALEVGGLASYLEGGFKLVLVPEGPTPPAALVRLVTPGVVVAQVTDPGDLGPLLEAPTPVVIALVGDAAARFVHDPRGGDELRERLTVHHLPDDEDLRDLTFREREDLAQLRCLERVLMPEVGAPGAPDAGSAATATSAPAPPLDGRRAPGSAARDPSASVDRLAAWLLEQADLSGLEG